MQKVVLEIACLRAGQSGPFADSVYEAIYTFTTPHGVWTPTREQVLAFVKADYRDDFRVETPGDNTPIDYLETLKQLALNKWRVVIVSPFMD